MVRDRQHLYQKFLFLLFKIDLLYYTFHPYITTSLASICFLSFHSEVLEVLDKMLALNHYCTYYDAYKSKFHF